MILKSHKKNFKYTSIFIYIFVLFWVLLASFPFLWTFWGSFKVELDFFSIANWTNAITGENTKQTYGSPFTFVGYHGAWVQEEFWKAFLNTSLVEISNSLSISNNAKSLENGGKLSCSTLNCFASSAPTTSGRVDNI